MRVIRHPILGLWALLISTPTYALPWEGPLRMVHDSLSSEVAPMVLGIATIVLAFVLFTSEARGFMGMLLKMAFGASLALSTSTWLGMFG